MLVLLLALLLLGLPAVSDPSASEQQSTPHPEGALRWAVLIDLSRNQLTRDSLSATLLRHVAREFEAGSRGARLFAAAPTIIDSEANVVTALVGISNLLADNSTYPDVLFLVDGTTISAAVADLLKQNIRNAEVLLISAQTASVDLCDTTLNPRTICIVPQDQTNALALLEMTSALLEWSSMAVVYSNNGYGRRMKPTVTAQIQSAITTPTIVDEVFMDPSSTAEEDDELVQGLLQHKPRGIACFLGDRQMLQLHAAFERAALSVNETVFLVGSREALGVLPQLTGRLASGSESAAWGALLVSAYTPITGLEAMGLVQDAESTINPAGAYVLSHLLDAVRLVGLAGGVTSATALRSERFDGLTGPVAFNGVYHSRIEVNFSLMMAEYNVTRPLATWFDAIESVPAVLTVRESQAMAALVPASPLRAVTVCLASPGTEGNVEMLDALMFVLLQYNALSQPNTSFIPRAINTGESGVLGLPMFISIARTCTILTGPGRAAVTLVLTPVINEMKLTQIDYNSANDFFTEDVYAYPYFSRSIPPDSFTYEAHGEISVYFAWERAIIIATTDLVGRSRADAMTQALSFRNVFVEKTYFLDGYDKGTIVECLNEIFNYDVSRIVHILLPLSGDSANMFFYLVDELPFMRQYVFFLSKNLCQYGAANPVARNKLQSSICVYPYVPEDRLERINKELNDSPAIRREMQTVLRNGGFFSVAEAAGATPITAAHGFAVDAAYMVIDAVERAVAAKVLLNRSVNLLPFVRNTTDLDNFTGPFSIRPDGNRNFAAYNMDIQIPGATLVVGLWDQHRKPALTITYTKPFLWMTNLTSIPLDTFRDISFVLGNTATASTAAIVLSVLGSVCTVGAFFFCYRHYREQKKLIEALEGDEVPVTEVEMQRLRCSEEAHFN